MTKLSENLVFLRVNWLNHQTENEGPQGKRAGQKQPLNTHEKRETHVKNNKIDTLDKT